MEKASFRGSDEKSLSSDNMERNGYQDIYFVAGRFQCSSFIWYIEVDYFR